MRLKLNSRDSNIEFEIKGKEKGGNGLKEHFKKHKGVYITASISLATLVGVQKYNHERLKYVIREAYEIGTRHEAIITWNKLLDQVKKGNLSIETINEIDDDLTKTNIEVLKKYSKSEG